MRFATAILLMMLGLPAFANDSAVYGVGGALRPMDEHPSVRMLRERIDARLTKAQAWVRCEFVFKNDGPATTVKIGFPERSWGDVSRRTRPSFAEFRSSVDGRPVRTRFVPAPEGEELEYTAWHVKDVHFDRRQTRTIVEQYTSLLGGVSDGSRFFSYILRTGSSWKGTIGRAVVNLDVSAIPRYFALSPRPQGYTRRGSTITWMLTDFEPEHDIQLSVTARYPIVNGKNTWAGTWGYHYSVQSGVAMGSVVGFREAGAQTDWEDHRRGTVLRLGDKTVEVTAYSKTALVNGKPVRLPAAPAMADNDLVVPLAAVTRALGGTASYDPETGQVELTLPKTSDRQEGTRRSE